MHRDIAPPNVLISFHGEVKVTDFGLARSILKNERTAPGIVYGRVAYLAPEQARGEQADPRTDIFATGVILWELLTGRPLHDSTDDAVKNLEKARHPRIEPPSHITRGLPTSIDQLALKALQADRNNRFKTAEEFRKALADELGRIAPGTDASRVGTFLKDLFGDEIKTEAVERERLLREELPKLRARTHPPNRPDAAGGCAGDCPADPPGVPVDRAVDRSVAAAGAELCAAAAPQRPHRRAAPPPLPGARLGRRSPIPPLPRDPPTERASARRGHGATAELVRSRVRHRRRDETRHRAAAPRARTTGARGALARAPSPAPDIDEMIDPGSDQELDNLVGEILDGRYRVERLLGTGGMGAVYEAEHIEIGKRVALKVLHPQLLAAGRIWSSASAARRARRRRSATPTSSTSPTRAPPTTATCTSSWSTSTGVELGEVLRHERRVAPDRTVHIGTQICRALAAAHAAASSTAISSPRTSS